MTLTLMRSQIVAIRHLSASAPDRIKKMKTALMRASLALKFTHSPTAMPSDQAETTTSMPRTPLAACPIPHLRTAPPDHSALTAMPPLQWQDSRPQWRPHPNSLLFISSHRHFRASVLPLACQVSRPFCTTRRIIRRLLRLTSTATTHRCCTLNSTAYDTYLDVFILFLFFLSFFYLVRGMSRYEEDDFPDFCTTKVEMAVYDYQLSLHSDLRKTVLYSLCH